MACTKRSWIRPESGLAAESGTMKLVIAGKESVMYNVFLLPASTFTVVLNRGTESVLERALGMDKLTFTCPGSTER
jgi:hypothetical protein